MTLNAKDALEYLSHLKTPTLSKLIARYAATLHAPYAGHPVLEATLCKEIILPVLGQNKQEVLKERCDMCDCYKANIPMHSSLLKEPHADDCEDVTNKKDEGVDFDALYRWFGNVHDDTECYHVMVDYVGFTEKYKYCKHCDYKEK